METISLVFVILHYLTIDDTIECVNSIKEKVDTDSYKIVIVDNASSNNSGDQIHELYSADKHIKVIINSNNLGFSKGLNIGISYARTNYNPLYIITMNNDMWLISNNILSIINSKYKQYGFSVMGPMIITRDGKCNINPIRNTHRSYSEAISLIKRRKKYIRLCKFHVWGLYQFVINFIPRKQKNKKPEIFLTDQINYKLHGSFWIFSKKYFEVFEGLDERTFLYGEEELLFLHTSMNGLKTVYTPELVIFHKEDSSTDDMFHSKTKKVLFVSEHSINSLQIYIDTIKKYDTK